MFGRNRLKNFSDKLIENSNKMYDELLEKEIIPAIERENSEDLSVHEMEEIVEKLDEKVNEYNQKINEEHDYYVCPNGQKLTFQYHSHRTDRYGFKRKLKVYQSENCDSCPLRSYCTRAKEGNHRKLYINELWEKQKEYIRVKLSEEETGDIDKKGKKDVETVFGFSQVNLFFTRFSVRGKWKVEND